MKLVSIVILTVLGIAWAQCPHPTMLAKHVAFNMNANSMTPDQLEQEAVRRSVQRNSGPPKGGPKANAGSQCASGGGRSQMNQPRVKISLKCALYFKEDPIQILESNLSHVLKK